jgi:Bacteriocin-protection, YdeI or OmpD-Associated/Domain of unknown function (DUF1905)
MEFRATVVLGGKTATGIQVPDEIVETLGSGKRPPVVVTIGDYSYRTTVAAYTGSYWVPLAAEHREAAGVAAEQEVDVAIELDTAPREVTVPEDLGAAMDDDARTAYEGLSFTHRKEWVRWVEEAKKPETRAARVARTVEGLKAGRKTR